MDRIELSSPACGGGAERSEAEGGESPRTWRALAVALFLGACALGSGTAHAAVPQICVQNNTRTPMFVTIGASSEPRTEPWHYGVVFGIVVPDTGQCQWVDVNQDQENLIDFAPVARGSSDNPGADARWHRCTVGNPTATRSVWVIRGRGDRLRCRLERGRRDLEGPGDYE